MEGAAKSLSGFSGSLFGQRFLMHSLGFVISFFGTRPLINKLGERVCLLLIPIIMSTLLLIFMLFYNEQAVLIVFMLIGTLNYAFASPLRESLYIPTVRDIRFKSKAWIDSFGTKFSKGCGALIIGFVQYFAVTGSPLFMNLYSVIFASISGLWIVLAYFLGKKYDDLVENDKVIGSDD
jgi:ATP:ADP antiporter, AAA family